MKYSALLLKLSVAVLAYISYANADAAKDKRQVGHSAAGTLNTEEDRDTAASAFASAGIGSGKYFQYAHVPAKDHYEFGHRRGNEHHFTERHEKAHPHAGEFKTKVRWGDKHGGYGEHYWDFNHAGHGRHDDGEETKNEPQYAAYEATEDKPKYVAARAKREPNPDADVEFIDETAKFLDDAGFNGKHGGNYKWAPVADRVKRNPDLQISSLLFDPSSGRVVDQNTGNVYELTPVA